MREEHVSRADDFARHLADLRLHSYEGATSRDEREEVFQAATNLLDPVVRSVLQEFDSVMLAGGGEISDDGLRQQADGSMERCWNLSWPGQRSAAVRVGDATSVAPITIRALFPQGWTHGHLAGSTMGHWPLQVKTQDDAARQALVIWVIAEGELHERIFESVHPWECVPAPVGVGS